MKCRHPFFLLEILISLGLLSLVLSVLFSFWMNFSRMERKLAKTRLESLPIQQVQVRMDLLLSSLLPPKNNLFSPETLYTGDDGLFIIFDHGVDPEPAFSGPVRGKIFLEGGDKLMLEIRPLEKEKTESFRRVELCSLIDRVLFQFFYVKPLDKEPRGVWLDHWSKEQDGLPSMIRLFLWRKGELHRFVFFIPLVEPMATY